VSAWPWHGKLDRAGGIAEWPAMRATVSRVGEGPAVKGATLDVQLAERAEEASVVHSFTERTGSATIAFLVPTPLRENAKEFETGSQMTARHLKWAQEATNNQPISLKQFTFCTALWGHYDPDLARQAIATLKLLGVNIIGNYDPAMLREAGIRTYGTTWSYGPDATEAQKGWDRESESYKTDPARAKDLTHFVVGDEVQTLNFMGPRRREAQRLVPRLPPRQRRDRRRTSASRSTRSNTPRRRCTRSRSRATPTCRRASSCTTPRSSAIGTRRSACARRRT
jgi:hypothetical protein